MMPPASPAAFEKDLARFRAEFERLDAIIDLGEEGRFVDPTKAPEWLIWTYDRLRQYGYAHGLLGTQEHPEGQR